jgi:hypothetical protein
VTLRLGENRPKIRCSNGIYSAAARGLKLGKMILRYGTYYQTVQELLSRLEELCEPRQPPLSTPDNSLPSLADTGFGSPRHFAALLGESTARVTPLTEMVSEQLGRLENEAKQLELERTTDRASRLRKYLVSLSPTVNLYGDERLPHELRTLREALFDDLEKRSVWFPDEAKTKFIVTYGTRMNFAEIRHAMPDAHYELINAQRCYGTDNDAACVYHSLNAAEYALRAIAQRFKIPKKQHDTWGTMLVALRAKIEELQQKKPTKQRNAMLDYYSELLDQCVFFNEHWRKKVAHLPPRYTSAEALDALTRSGEFVKLLVGHGLKLPHQLPT